MTTIIKNGVVNPTPKKELVVGDVFSWGTQDVWYLKTKKGARPIGQHRGMQPRKRTERECLEISRMSSFCVAMLVTVTK